MAMRIENGDGDEIELEPQKKASLGEILELTRRADDDIENMEIDLTELGKDLRSKVDNIVDYLDQCESRAKTLRHRANLFEKKAKALENRAKSLKDYVANTMSFDSDLRFAEQGIRDAKPRLSGNDFEFVLQFRDSVEIKTDANPSLFLKCGKTFIRRSYEWDKPALKKALKENKTELSEYAALKKTPHIRINPKA